MADDDAVAAKRRQLLREQQDFFKQGGVSLEEARSMGVGFLYEDAPQDKAGKEQQQERPEDAIPDLPENREAREFLAKAPTKGLFMPLGKEVKVMKCWRCKQYGHRTGDRECPLFLTGNIESDARRQAREDPMSAYVGQKLLNAEEKEARRAQLQALMEEIRAERKEKKRRKKEKKKEKKRRKKEGKKQQKRDKESSDSKKRRKHDSSNSEDSGSGSDSSSSSDSSGSEKTEREERKHKKHKK